MNIVEDDFVESLGITRSEGFVEFSSSGKSDKRWEVFEISVGEKSVAHFDPQE